MGFFNNNNIELNKVEIAKRAYLAQGKTLIDLTESNPTKCGLIFPKDILLASANKYFSSRLYRPDSKGLIETREAIAAYYAKCSPKLGIEAKNIIVTASTSEAYRLLFSLLCEPNDNLLSPDVTYPLFEYFAEDQRIKLRNYRIRESQDWEIDPISLDLAVNDKTRGILVVSPHNPTGKIQYRTDKNLLEFGLPIIADEVFSEFIHTTKKMPSLGCLYPQVPVFHLNGISKMFALPDLKLGWIAMNQIAYELYAERLELLNDTYLSASSLTQTLLSDLFNLGNEFKNMMCSRVADNVQYVFKFLRNLGFPIKKLPEGGTFLLAPLPLEWDEEDFVIKLIKKGAFVHPGYFYNVPSQHIMISCLLERHKLEAGLNLIAKVIEN